MSEQDNDLLKFIFDGSKEFRVRDGGDGGGGGTSSTDNLNVDGDNENNNAATANNVSPWSAFLIDDYEDDDYAENCEYDDTEFFGMSEGIAVNVG